MSRSPDATIIGEGDEFELGSLTIEARLTSGHSPGGLTYVVRGLGASGGDCRRLDVCRIDGRRRCFL